MGNRGRQAPASRRPSGTPRGESKVEGIVRHGVHQIATGTWRAGEKLPPLRDAERRWSVNQLTVMKAYRRLEALGLVESVPRSGFFVADNSSVDRLGRHRAELDRVYERTRADVEKGAGLSPLGVFRYLEQLAEARARERPECAFVECTPFQARLHAREITERLRVPCLALTTEELDGRGERVPRHVRTLLTTSFHHHEVDVLSGEDGPSVVDVPIVFSPELVLRLTEEAREALFLALDEDTARHVAEDFESLSAAHRLEVGVGSATPEEIDAVVTRESAGGDRRVLLLSPTLWDAVSEEPRSSPWVFPVDYRIREDAWPAVADGIGLPLGALAERSDR
ncbi:MAG: GntR family transcriptional regulator [Planctomycetota bacterium]